MPRRFDDEGRLDRAKKQIYSLSYFKVGDGWKDASSTFRKSIYVYKARIITTLSMDCKAEATPPDKIFQGFCLRQELEEFCTHAVLPRDGYYGYSNSIFVATTPAMEKRIRKDLSIAYYYRRPLLSDRSAPFYCKNPYDMLKNGKAKVRFWEHNNGSPILMALDGKVLAK